MGHPQYSRKSIPLEFQEREGTTSIGESGSYLFHKFSGRPQGPGDQWCLCAPRWTEAFEAGNAPKVVLEATHAATLEWASLGDLEAHRHEP